MKQMNESIEYILKETIKMGGVAFDEFQTLYEQQNTCREFHGDHYQICMVEKYNSIYEQLRCDYK